MITNLSLNGLLMGVKSEKMKMVNALTTLLRDIMSALKVGIFLPTLLIVYDQSSFAKTIKVFSHLQSHIQLRAQNSEALKRLL